MIDMVALGHEGLRSDIPAFDPGVNCALVGYGWVGDNTAANRFGLAVQFRNNGSTLRFMQYLGSILTGTLAANDVIYLNAMFPVTVP